MSTARSPQQQRLFMALWPTPAVARRLSEVTTTVHGECGGRKVPTENQHITVVFLGSVDIERIADIQRLMRAAARECFELELDTLQYRKRGGMVWARAMQTPKVLSELAQRLRSALAVLGFTVEDRALVPHITLLRDARKPLQLPEFSKASWRVDELTLVRSNLSHNGARYETLFRVPLSSER